MLAAQIAASGLTPLQYLLSVMRDVRLRLATRLEAAKAAAPYVHPRLASLTNAKGDGPAEVLVTVTDEDRVRALEALIARRKTFAENPDGTGTARKSEPIVVKNRSQINRVMLHPSDPSRNYLG